MEMEWKGMNVDLLELYDCIKGFFECRGFRVFGGKSNGEYHVVAIPMLHHKIVEKVQVNITGNPDDFTVKFVAGSSSHRMAFIGSLMAFIGGGFLAKKGFDSEETLDRLEKDFRVFISEKVWQLRRV
jgi:hypothetical protein